jgi:hypothetical protein
MTRQPLLPLAVLFGVALLLVPAGTPSAAEKTDAPKGPRTFTIKKILSLSEALEELEKQTGVAVEDRRNGGSDPKLNLDLNKLTFWQAVDQIAKEADVRVSIYERDGKVAIQDGPHRAFPISYSGQFRVAVRRVTAAHDLDTDARMTTVQLEIAWEPGFRPFFLETRPSSIEAKDDKGADVEVRDEESGRTQITESRLFTTLNVNIPSPPRGTARLGLLKGKCALIAPTKWLTFNFPTLEEMKKNKKAAEVSKDGVTAKLDRLTLDDDLWTLDVSVEYPKGGPRFESFESWIVYNEMALVAGEKRFENNGGYETGPSGEYTVSASYHFVDDKGKDLVRGKPGDWKVEYLAPGPMADFSVPFEFKDVPLP